MRVERIHILGPSGAGTSSLGRALSPALGLDFLDSDDFFWLPDEPPFSRKRPVGERVALLKERAPTDGRWLISGSMMGWGDFLMPSLDLVIYLWKPAEVRLPRLAARERERFGPSVDPGGKLRRQYETFLEWAGSYDSGGLGMRSALSEGQWMDRLSCPVLRIEEDISVAREVERVLAFAASA